MTQGALHFESTLGTQNFENGILKIQNGIRSASDTAKKEASSMDDTFRNLSVAIGGYFTAQSLMGFTKELINVRGEFQKTEIAFTTMLGSSEKAKALMGQMVDLAAKTPFSLQEVSSGAKQLLAFQVPANQVVDILTRMGNIAAGLGVPLSRINLVYGQVRAKGKLMGDDLRQFTEAGIPMIAELAKKFKTSESAITEMVTAGKVGFKDVQDVLYNLTNEGGMFFNLMEKQSGSLSGKVANLGDAWDQMLNKMGEANEGFLYSGLAQLTDLVENYEKVLGMIETLVIAYGAYKAAIIVTAAAQNMANASIATEVGLLSFSTRMKLGRAIVTQRQTAATLLESKAELASAQAKYLALQAEVSSLAVKRQKMVALAAEKTAMAQTAAVQLSLARAELRSLGANATARQTMIATKNVEKAQNQVLALQEQAAIARKGALTASTRFYTAQKELENSAVILGNASKKVEIAQDLAATAAKNANTIATTNLTIAQRLQVIATTAAQRATAFLNATLFANPYALAAALIAALAYAVYKYATAMTVAEESQKRMNDDLLASIPAITEQESKIKSLIKVVQDQNSTDDQRKSAIKQIQTLTNGRLGQLDEEAIKTGKATDMIKVYIETLKLEAEAKRYVNELGRLESDTENLKAGRDSYNLSDTWDDFTDFDSNEFWSLSKRKQERVDRIVKAKEDEKKEIQKKLDALAKKGINISETVITEEPAKDIGPKKGTQLWYEAEIQRLEALKQAAIVGSKEWNKYRAQIEAYNKLLNPEKAKVDNKQMAEIFPLGSIKELQQRAQLINDAIQVGVDNQIKLRKLDKYGKDKDKNGNPFLTGETISMEEAYKRMDAIDAMVKRLQRKSYDEEIAELERQWRLKYQIAKTYGQEIAEAQFPNLKGDSYFDEIKKKYDDFNNRQSAGIPLSEEDLKRWQKLKGILDGLNGVKDPFTNFKDGLDKGLTGLTTYTDKIEYLNKRLYGLSGDEISEKFKAEIYGQLEAVEKDLQNVYDDFIRQQQSYESKKAAIKDQYAVLKTKIESDPTIDAEERKRLLQKLAKEEAKAYSSAYLDEFKKSKLWEKAFGDLDNVTYKALRKLRDALKKELQLKKGTLSIEDLTTLQKQIDKMDETLNSRNPFQAISIAIDKYKIKLGELDKAQKDPATSAEDLIGLQSETEMSFAGIVEAAGEAANVLLSFTEAIGDAFGGMSDELAETLANVKQLIQGIVDVVVGYFSGDWGKMISGIVQIVGTLIKMLNGDKKKERNIKEWAAEVENLRSQYDMLSASMDRALGEDTYKQQQAMIANLQQQWQVTQQMMYEEQDKKKSDSGKIASYASQMNSIQNQIQQIYDNMANQIAGTNAKDMATTLADALIEAYAKGEDAATAYGKVADDVMKNAVKNALKMQLLEGPMQNVIKQLIKNMGFNQDGTGSFDGLTDAERDQIKAMMQAASNNYMQALGAYGDLFGNAAGLADASLEGAVKGVSEETASIIAGQLNAIRNNQGQMMLTSQESIEVFRSSYLQLVQIEYNTRYLKYIYRSLSGTDADPWKAGGHTFP